MYYADNSNRLQTMFCSLSVVDTKDEVKQYRGLGWGAEGADNKSYDDDEYRHEQGKGGIRAEPRRAYSP